MALLNYYKFLELGRELISKSKQTIGATSSEMIDLQTSLIDINDTLIKVAERHVSDCRCARLASYTQQAQHESNIATMLKGLEGFRTQARLIRNDRYKLRCVINYRPDTSKRLANIVEEHMLDVKRLSAMGFSWAPLLPHIQQVGREVSSHAATAFLALVRLGMVPRQQSLVLHVVGAENIEGKTPEEAAKRWDVLVRLLALGGATKLVLAFVGPQVANELHSQVFHAKHEANDGRQLDLEFRWSKEFYHDWWGQRSLNLDVVSYPMPDLVLLPNAGLWVFEEWEETLRLVYSQIKRPLVVTARSFGEAIKDEAAISYMGGMDSWLWRPEVSPYPVDPWVFQPGARVSGKSPEEWERITGGNANSAWQCLFAQAHDARPLEGAPCEYLEKLNLLVTKGWTPSRSATGQTTQSMSAAGQTTPSMSAAGQTGPSMSAAEALRSRLKDISANLKEVKGSIQADLGPNVAGNAAASSSGTAPEASAADSASAGTISKKAKQRARQKEAKAKQKSQEDADAADAAD